MARPNKFGVKGLYLNNRGRYRINHQWFDEFGMMHRHRETLPTGTTIAMAIDRARTVLALALEGRLKPTTPRDGWFDEIEPPESPGVYAAIGAGNFVKIGRTSKSIARRLSEVQTGHPVPLRLLAVLSKNPCDEIVFHKRFARTRTHGEWFAISADIVTAIRNARVAAIRETEAADQEAQAKEASAAE